MDETESQVESTEEVVETPPEPEVPLWRRGIDEAPIEELREHPRFKGILGSELEARRLTWESQNNARLAAEAAQKFENELLELADKDPDALADRLKSDVLTRRQQQEVATLRSGERDQIARQIGQSFRALPEWSELTAADHEEFFKALAGKKDEEIIPTFNRVAAERIAEVRSRKQTAAWQSTELEKQREAIRLEEQNKLLVGGDRPGIGRARGNGAISDEPNWRTEPQKWEAWYSRQTTTARR